MKKETIEKAHELLEEIKNLKQYKDLLTREHKNVVHFQIAQHYGELQNWDVVRIDLRHNPRLFKVVDDIILELEKELELI